MSKFFAGGASDTSDFSSSEEEDLWLSQQSDVSESLDDSSSEEEALSEDDEDEPQQARRNRFLKGAGSDSEDSDEEDDRGAIKSAKDKLIDEVNAAVKTFDSAVAEGDWVEASAAFDKAFKTQDRAMRVYKVVPASIVKLLSSLDATLADARAKKLNPSSSKAVNAINQRVKKLAKEYASHIESYRADPDNYNPEPPTVSETQSKLGTPQPQLPEEGEFSSATLFTVLETIIQGRGKKKTDKTEQIHTLERLYQVADSPYQQLSVLLMMIPIRFDLFATGQMPQENWKAIETNIGQLLEVLEANPEYVVIETAKVPEEIDTPPAPGPGGIRQIPGSIASLVERLNDEHLKALQIIDPHTSEYVERFQHHNKTYDLFLRAQAHLENNFERLGTPEDQKAPLHRLLSQRLDHIYYKPAPAIVATELASWEATPANLTSAITPRLAKAPEEDSKYTIKLIDSISKTLNNQPNLVLRQKATLALIYHYALNDMYVQARDLINLSQLQSSIQTADPAVQIMFNRAMVQVGLSAFRCGLIEDAHQALQEVCSSSRLKEHLKEVLGQGTAKFSPTTAATPDRSLILPFHMHINTELIECVYLTSSLLIEVPQIAGARAGADKKKAQGSKPFRRMLDFHDRQVLIGPSENARDHIIQAAKALQQGDWQESVNLLSSIKVWALFSTNDKIMKMLTGKLQVEGLVTYLLTFCGCYDSLSLEYLVDKFQLPVDTVRSTIQKLISADELMATLDDSNNYLAFSPAADPSKLQLLSASLSDKIAILNERNERIASDANDAKKNPRFNRKITV